MLIFLLIPKKCLKNDWPSVEIETHFGMNRTCSLEKLLRCICKNFWKFFILIKLVLVTEFVFLASCKHNVLRTAF